MNQTPLTRYRRSLRNQQLFWAAIAVTGVVGLVIVILKYFCP